MDLFTLIFIRKKELVTEGQFILSVCILYTGPIYDKTKSLWGIIRNELWEWKTTTAILSLFHCFNVKIFSKEENFCVLLQH
jgi:hypothetical protein